ncbi:unnamed protein product, partial [Prorocentrum cordatum]
AEGMVHWMNNRPVKMSHSSFGSGEGAECANVGGLRKLCADLGAQATFCEWVVVPGLELNVASRFFKSWGCWISQWNVRSKGLSRDKKRNDIKTIVGESSVAERFPDRALVVLAGDFAERLRPLRPGLPGGE